MTLKDINIGEYAIIKKVIATGSIKRRLLDIGLTPGTKVECVLQNPGKNLIAYMIRGALIAIREEDVQNILIEAM